MEVNVVPKVTTFVRPMHGIQRPSVMQTLTATATQIAAVWVARARHRAQGGRTAAFVHSLMRVARPTFISVLQTSSKRLLFVTRTLIALEIPTAVDPGAGEIGHAQQAGTAVSSRW